MNSSHPVLFVVGPTASGKSDLALQLALHYKGCILNCDSLQTYQRLDIGTAKPSLAERSQVSHFLFDYIAPPQTLNAAQFREQAREVLERETAWHSVVAAGGSGFYIRALQTEMYGHFDVKAEVLSRLYETEQAGGLEALYKEMLLADPSLREQISSQDSYRIKRSLGLMWTHKKSLQQIRQETQQANTNSSAWPYKSIKIGIKVEREELRQRVRKRMEKMLERGWLEEVRTLLEEGWEDWMPLASVGYKEIVAHFRGEYAFEEMQERIVNSTMQLAKKQMTWFKKDEEIHWLKSSDLNQALDVVESWKKGNSK